MNTRVNRVPWPMAYTRLYRDARMETEEKEREREGEGEREREREGTGGSGMAFAGGWIMAHE